MTKHITVILLGSALLFSQGLFGETLPAWLQQVAEQKRQQPEQMLTLLQQHQAELPALPKQVQAQWYAEQAALLSTLGRHQEQQQAAEQGLALLGELQSLSKVELLYALGFAREMQSDYPTALQHYEQGIALATLLDDEKRILQGQINQAAVFSNQNQNQQALALLKDTYQRAQRLNDTELLAEVNAELGLLYASLAFEKDSIALLETALKLYEKLGWQKNQITVLFNLARSYGFMEQYDLSLQSYTKMLQKSQQSQDVMNLYHAYLGLAITSGQINKGDAALKYIAKAEEYLPQLQSTSHISTHYYEKALIYQNLKQSSLAMQQLMLAEQSLNNEGVEDNSPVWLNIMYLKAELLSEQGQFDRAYRHLHDFVLLFQDVRDKENELAIEQMRLSFEQEQQQQRNRLLVQDNELKALRLNQAERDNQVQWLWLSILACSTLILLILLLWQLNRHKAKNRSAGSDAPEQTG